MCSFFLVWPIHRRVRYLPKPHKRDTDRFKPYPKRGKEEEKKREKKKEKEGKGRKKGENEKEKEEKRKEEKKKEMSIIRMGGDY